MAGTSPSGSGRRAPIVGINVTPMVDVVLVLLVIMMVAANYIVSQSMNVDLPKAANGDGGATSLAVVTIGPTGSFRWNDNPVNEGELVGKLKELSEDTNLVISADAQATHGVVVHVLDLAKAEGITHFAIAVEAPA